MYAAGCAELTGLEVPLVCLALAVYEEARGEPLVGQEAVAMVVLNRSRQAHKPVCQVVFAPGQFSWAKGFHSKVDTCSKSWKQSEMVAKRAQHMSDFTGGATSFHSVHVHPEWAAHLHRTGTWGHHHFYRKSKRI